VKPLGGLLRRMVLAWVSSCGVRKRGRRRSDRLRPSTSGSEGDSFMPRFLNKT
jgi:hypothetical protein